MRRASISIASNIAEGGSRTSKNDQAHFYIIAYSSAIELLNQLIICQSLSFISDEKLRQARLMIEPITGGVSNLKKAIRQG